MASTKNAYQFKISLQHIEPQIWRRILVPPEYTFWDLHVAIQDAMGWCDCHLHSFRVGERRENRVEIGVPTPGFEEQEILAGWDVPVSDFCKTTGTTIQYLYDFGDHWDHQIVFEEIVEVKTALKLPVCLEGERACPPEDCGGLPGYYHLLEVLDDKNHTEYAGMVDWLESHLINYMPYNPAEFNAKAVQFDNPLTRWKQAFGPG